MGRRDTFGLEYRAIIGDLAGRRRAAGITQVELALAIGTDQSKVSKIERFERRLDIIDYVRICRAIGIDPGEPLRAIALPEQS